MNPVYRRAKAPLVLALLLGTACSGETAGPNPPPPPVSVVTTVEVTPGTVGLVAGDTTRLRLTVRDQSGATMSGRTPTWSSSNQSIATVSTSGLVTAAAAGQAVITATVEGKQGSAQISVAPPARVALDSSASRSAVVNPKGDTLTVTASNGLVYVLELPAFAVDSAVRVTMTPVTAIQRLPLTGGLVGAVELAPAGLRFNLPVTLRIKTSPTIPAGQKLIGLQYVDGGETLLPSPAQRRTDEVVITLTSIGFGFAVGASPDRGPAATSTAAAGAGVGVGAALGTTQDISTLPLPPLMPAAMIARVQLAPLSYPTDETAILTILRGAYFRAVRDAALLAVTAADLRTAMFDWISWDAAAIDVDNPAGDLRRTLKPEDRFLLTELVAGFRRIRPAIDQQCLAQRDAIAGFNLLSLHGILLVYDSYGILDSAGLTRPAMLASSCVQVFPVQVQFPDPAVPNQPGQLELQFGLKFGTDPTLLNTVFAVEFTVAGSTGDGTQVNNTDDVGRFATAVTATGLGSLTITGRACVPQQTTLLAFDLCAPIAITRSFGRIVTGNLVINSQAGLLASTDVAKVTGNLFIRNVASTDLAELGALVEVGGLLTIDDNPALRTLRGLRSIRQVGSLAMRSNPQLADLDGLIPLQRVGTLDLRDNTALATLAGIAGIDEIGALILGNAPLVTSLQALRGTAILEGIQIFAMTGLTTLADLTGGAGTLRNLDVAGNSHLTDLDGLVSIRHVTGSVNIVDNAVTSLAGLAGLTTVGGGVRIEEPQLASFVLPSLGSVDALFLDPVIHPLVSSFSFPALTTVTGRLLGGGVRTCSSGGPRAYNFPALTSADEFLFGNLNDDPLCPVTVSAPQLRRVTTGLALIGPALSSATVGQTLSAPSAIVAIRRTGLSALSLQGLDIESFSIEENNQLTSLAVSGAVSRNVAVVLNPQLSTQSIQAQLAAMAIGGTVTISGNKIP